WVPITGGRMVLTADEQAIETRHLGFTISPHEECGVEEAVRIVEAGGGEVVVLTLGPAEAEEQLRDCMAIGADRGILLKTDGTEWDAQEPAALSVGAGPPSRKVQAGGGRRAGAAGVEAREAAARRAGGAGEAGRDPRSRRRRRTEDRRGHAAAGRRMSRLGQGQTFEVAFAAASPCGVVGRVGVPAGPDDAQPGAGE